MDRLKLCLDVETLMNEGDRNGRIDSMRKGTSRKRTWEERYRKEKMVGL